MGLFFHVIPPLFHEKTCMNLAMERALIIKRFLSLDHSVN